MLKLFYWDRRCTSKARPQAWKLNSGFLVWRRFLSFQQPPFLSISSQCLNNNQHHVSISLTSLILNLPSSCLPLCFSLECFVLSYPLQNFNLLLRPRPNVTSPVEICSTPLNIHQEDLFVGRDDKGGVMTLNLSSTTWNLDIRKSLKLDFQFSSLWNGDCITLHQRSADFFCKEPDIQYFQFCQHKSHPCNYAILPL